MKFFNQSDLSSKVFVCCLLVENHYLVCGQQLECACGEYYCITTIFQIFLSELKKETHITWRISYHITF